MNKKDNNEDELPKLNIEEENEFKKLKLSIEHGPSYFGKGNANLPPEIEGQFLDYISNFEKAYQNAKPISVFEKIGSPEFKLSATLTDDEIDVELERILDIMGQNGLAIDMLADYENESRLLYNFITEELFSHEIDNMNVPGMVTNIIYEEFHPNHEYDLKRDTEDFLRMFFTIEDDFYNNFHSEDASNHIVLNNFRSLFQEFEMTFFDFQEITFDEQDAIVRFKIDFWAKISKSDTKISYSGEGNITFRFEHGYWYLREVVLPINN